VAVPTDFLIEKYPERFPRDRKPKLYRAPGRVNLIGEHTDYNQGFVLPIAIELSCYAAVAPGPSGGQLRVFSEDLLQGAEWPAADIANARPRGDWSDYVFGVAQQLVAHGYAVAPNDLLIHSTVPVGSGLSSSAALEVATALALADGRVRDRMELVRICHAAENRFVGMPCGIMDQFVSVFGQPGAAIKIDCRSLEYEPAPIPPDVAIIAVNTMVKHELGASAYRERVAECAAAVEFIRRSHPEVTSLRDAALEMLSGDIPEPSRKRARHVITENDRVSQFVEAAKANDLRRMGQLFVDSHRSLQHDYEVSCEELDYLVDTALEIEGVYGARMTGGGFGGCTVNLVAPGAAADFCSKITAAYASRWKLTPQVYDCQPSSGAGPV
jgi:galactokinase